MNDTRVGLVVVIALTIMGAADLLRDQAGASTAAGTGLLVVEVVAIIVGLIAVFAWARVRGRR
jgi:hypothetical protein